MSRWVPNFFTILRLVLVPSVVYTILTGRNRQALMLFLAAAVTDVLDGAAARLFQSTSQLGAYLDPVADKALLSGVFLALAAAGHIPWWLVGLIFGRDIYLLTAVGLFLWLTPHRKFPPSVWGKISTFVQVVTVLAWMARNMQHSVALDSISAATLWPCAVFTVWSGVAYTWRGVQLVRIH